MGARVAVWLCGCVAVSLCRCVAVSLCRCVAVSLCRCVAAGWRSEQHADVGAPLPGSTAHESDADVDGEPKRELLEAQAAVVTACVRLGCSCRFHVGLSVTRFGMMPTALPSPLHRLAEAIKCCSNGKLVMKECPEPPLSERSLLHLLCKTTEMEAYLLRNVRKSQDSTLIDESAAIDLAREVEVKIEQCSACTRGT